MDNFDMDFSELNYTTIDIFENYFEFEDFTYRLQPDYHQNQVQINQEEVSPLEIQPNQVIENQVPHLDFDIDKKSQKSLTMESESCSQSMLHNCPKHLIKIISDVLRLGQSWFSHSIDDLVGNLEGEVKIAFHKLLNLLYKCSKKMILNSISREMLIIVFQDGAQDNKKFKLNKNELVKQTFALNKESIRQAKKILRKITIDELRKNLKSVIQKSRFDNKEVVQRYVQNFISQLMNGKISQRITKSIKLKILRNELQNSNCQDFNSNKEKVRC